MNKHSLVVVANRLPIKRTKRGGAQGWESSPGGLVSALKPVLLRRPGAWVGWAGMSGPAPAAFEHRGMRYVPVPLSKGEVSSFYEGFSNRTLWPLYHDAVRTPEFNREWWRPYVEVNRRFAEAVARHLAPGGTAWIHDYHLQLVPRMLRQLRPDAHITFFLHIPFPPVELYAQLPWRLQLSQGLLGADLIGFQTRFGAQNFARLARRYHEIGGDELALEFEGRKIRVGGFPISIDVDSFTELASRPDVIQKAKALRKRFGPVDRIVLGVDRMDYTKGIDRRLLAYESLLNASPDLAKRVVFIQVSVPSREKVAQYEDERMRIEQLVGRINGRHSEAGRVPVHYMYRNLPIEKLVAYYLAADVMMVTPLRDGMNLVAKEYVACRGDDSGVLVLSEFTGSAHQLDSALLVNPHDIDGLAATLEEALRMQESEGRRRMSALRSVVAGSDVFSWAENFLGEKVSV